MTEKKPQQIVKENEVARLQGFFADANAVIMTNYRGITVSEDTALRSKFREAGITYVVAKNTLLKRACNNLDITALDEYFEGPTAIAFSEDPVALAKIVSTFISDTKKTEIKAGLLDGQLLSLSDINALAKLPSKEVLLSKLLGSMQSPLYGFAGVTTGLLRQLVTVTDAVREQKEKQEAC